MARPKPITADTLNKLSDGLLGRMIDGELERINHDIINRGHDGQARKLKIEIEFKVKGDRLVAKPRVKADLPTLEAPPTIAKYDQKAGGFMFSPDDASNPEQEAIPGAGTDD